jgi:serine/threonine protein phosphatase PrpC
MYRIAEMGSFSLPRPNKEVNEDFFLLPTYDCESNVVFAIADGVGSLDGASQASIYAINAIKESLSSDDFSIRDAMSKAKKSVDELAKHDRRYAESATTLTVVYIDKKEVTIGHIGDCRAYVKRNNKLFQLTMDHTRYQELLDSDEYPLQKMRRHKDRLSSVITKALSSNVELDYDIISIPINDLVDKDSIIISLMSDGAYDYWDKRPRFSDATMDSPSAFVTSLRKRIQKEPKDDFTCLSVKLTLA